MAQPAAGELSSPPILDEGVQMLRVARELAMGLRSLDDILELYHINATRWQAIKDNPRFHEIVQAEATAWESATNTRERVRLKSLAFLEEALPEFFGRAHDRREPLSAKVELLKAIAKVAGVDGGSKDADPGSKFSVTINLGGAGKLTFEDRTPELNLDAEEM